MGSAGFASGSSSPSDPDAPDNFRDAEWVECPDVESAWEAVKDDLRARELVYLGGEGAPPGGS